MSLVVIIPIKPGSQVLLSSNFAGWNTGFSSAYGEKSDSALDVIASEMPAPLRLLVSKIGYENRTFSRSNEGSCSVHRLSLSKALGYSSDLLIIQVMGDSGLSATQMSELPFLWASRSSIIHRLGVEEFDKADFARAIVIQNEHQLSDEELTASVECDDFTLLTRVVLIAEIVAIQIAAFRRLSEIASRDSWRWLNRFRYAFLAARVQRDLWWVDLLSHPKIMGLSSRLQRSFNLDSQMPQLFVHAQTVRSEIGLLVGFINGLLLLALAVVTVFLSGTGR